MPIITLTTDFGYKDHSVAVVKAALYSELSDLIIVDISHKVSPFHITEAAYIIKNAYQSFPKGSVHLIGVDAELTPENKHLAIYLDGHYFICANNGILSLIASEIKPEKIVEINIHNSIGSNFPALDVFVKVAAHICRGGTLEVIGKTINEIQQIKNLEPIVNEKQNQMIGHVIYIDNYGNVISNITKKRFNEIAKGRRFSISARNILFSKVYNSYGEAINFNLPKEKREEEGKRLALFNTSGFLELAVYKSNPDTVGSAASLFGLKLTNTITINFEKE